MGPNGGPSQYEIDDEFCGSTESGEIGTSGWSITGSGSVAEKAGDAAHPCLKTLSSSGVNGTIGRFHQGSASNTGVIIATDVEQFMAFVRPLSGTTAMEVRVGLCQDAANTAGGTDGVWFDFTAATSANWRTLTKSASNVEVNATSTAYAAGTWYFLHAIRLTASGNWAFYLNNVLQFTHTTQKPAVALNPCIAIETGEAVEKTIDVDYFLLRSNPLTRY